MLLRTIIIAESKPGKLGGHSGQDGKTHQSFLHSVVCITMHAQMHIISNQFVASWLLLPTPVTFIFNQWVCHGAVSGVHRIKIGSIERVIKWCMCIALQEQSHGFVLKGPLFSHSPRRQTYYQTLILSLSFSITQNLPISKTKYIKKNKSRKIPSKTSFFQSQSYLSFFRLGYFFVFHQPKIFSFFLSIVVHQQNGSNGG